MPCSCPNPCSNNSPEIVANGRKQAERILESPESRQRVRLQTREVVLPAKDSAAHDWVTQQQRSVTTTPTTPVVTPSTGTGTSTTPYTPVTGCKTVWVNGYTRKDGTKVKGHYRTTCY